MNRIFEIGTALARFADHGRAVHAGHDDVADQKLDRFAAAKEFERVFAIVGGDHLVAVAGERPLGDASDRRLVLDEQHGAAAPQFVLLGLGSALLASGTRFFAMDGQIDHELGALVDLRIGEDEAARLLDDAVDGREPEAGPLADLLGREEGLENLA